MIAGELRNHQNWTEKRVRWHVWVVKLVDLSPDFPINQAALTSSVMDLVSEEPNRVLRIGIHSGRFMEFKNIHDETRPFSGWPWKLSHQACLFQLVSSLSRESQEAMLAIYVTKELDLLAIDIVGKGSVSQVRADYRDVLARGCQIGAGGFFLVHNHPSGDSRPSQADLNYTLRMKRLSHELDLPLLDHFIVAGPTMHRVGLGMTESLANFEKRMEGWDG